MGRLDVLTRRRRTDGADSDELVRLYRATATDLSAIRSSAPDAETVARLSQLLGRTRGVLSGAHEPAWRDVRRFVGVSLPAALYRIRWWTCAVTVLFVAAAVIAGVWVATHEEVRNAVMTPAQQQVYAEQLFAQYYDPGAGFAARVWTNNAWIAALAVAGGITGVLPLYALVGNAVNIGAAGGVMAYHGRLDVFLQLIAPHGLLELTCIFVAGAAGLRIFWAWVDPGPRPRGRALAEEGRALFTVAVGLAGALAVSGLVEGFVTGSGLPWPVKIGIGVLVLAAFWTYTLLIGGRAAALGETGDLAQDRAGYTVATAG